MAKKDISENKVIPDSEKTGVYIAKVVTENGPKEVHRSRRLARKQGVNATPSIGSLNEANRVFKSEGPSEIPSLQDASVTSLSPTPNDVADELFSNLPTTPPPSLSLSSEDSLPSTESVDLSPELLDAHEVEVSKPNNEKSDTNPDLQPKVIEVNATPTNATTESQVLPKAPTLLQNAIGLLRRPSLTFGLTLGTGLFLTGFGLPFAALAFAGSLGSIEIYRRISDTHAKRTNSDVETKQPEQNESVLPEYGLELGSSSLLFGEQSSPSFSSSSSSSSLSSSSTLQSKCRRSTP